MQETQYPTKKSNSKHYAIICKNIQTMPNILPQIGLVAKIGSLWVLRLKTAKTGKAA
jgi:hypothetical protein